MSRWVGQYNGVADYNWKLPGAAGSADQAGWSDQAGSADQTVSADQAEEDARRAELGQAWAGVNPKS
jgi:hypothetical protein